MFHAKCICWKIFEHIGIGMAYLHVFLITMYEIDTAAEMYLEPLPTYMFELFSAKIVNTLRKKAPSISYYNKNETRALRSSEVQLKH